MLSVFLPAESSLKKVAAETNHLFRRESAMRRTCGLAVLAIVLMAPGVRAQSLRDTLSNLPADALAFAVTNRLELIDERLQAMAKKLDRG